MIIKVEKCDSLGTKKWQTKCTQIKPKLYLNNKRMNTVKFDESFVYYLGRHFDFNMTNKDHKVILLSKTNELLNTIDNLPLHPKNKILLYQRYLLSKIRWHLTVADLPIIWVKQNLDNIASKFIRSWLEIPAVGTLNIIRFNEKLYMNISLVLVSSWFLIVLPNVKLCWEINWKTLVIKILLKFTALQRKEHYIWSVQIHPRGNKWYS